MFLFRLFDFFVRVFLSFGFVFILQVQFDGQSLEKYLINFSQSFFLTKALNSVGEDGAKLAKNFQLNEEQKKKKRELANKKRDKMFENFSKRINFPNQNKTNTDQEN